MCPTIYHCNQGFRKELSQSALYLLPNRPKRCTLACHILPGCSSVLSCASRCQSSFSGTTKNALKLNFEGTLLWYYLLVEESARVSCVQCTARYSSSGSPRSCMCTCTTTRSPRQLYSYYSQLSSLRSCMILTSGRCIYAFFSVFGNSASGFLYVYDLRLLPFSPLLRRLFLEYNGEEEAKAAASRSSGFGFSVVHQLVKGEVLEEWLYSIHHADSGCTVLIFAPAKHFYQARRVQSNQ